MYSVVTMTACRAIYGIVVWNSPDYQVKAVINLTTLHHFASCSAANLQMQDRLAHCESCVQGIALKLQAMKIQLLDYPLLSKTGFFLIEKLFDLRNQQIWDVAAGYSGLLGQSWRTADLIICEPACKCSVHNSQNYSCF